MEYFCGNQKFYHCWISPARKAKGYDLGIPVFYECFFLDFESIEENPYKEQDACIHHSKSYKICPKKIPYMRVW